MSAAAATVTPDPLEVAKRSPEVVLAKDRDAWLALFTEGASIEDPVGAGAHVGAAARARFWEVFIAPQKKIVFEPRRDFVSGDTVLRYVTIATVTPVADEPFALPALVEYRVEGDRIASLRAFWEPVDAVRWHARQGARGLGGLVKHGLRTSRGLGLGAATRFGLAMRPKVDRAAARTIADELAAAAGGDADAWRDLTDGATVEASDASGDRKTGAAARDAIVGAGAVQPVEVIAAGSWVAAVLEGESLALAAIVATDRGRPRELTILRG